MFEKCRDSVHLPKAAFYICDRKWDHCTGCSEKVINLTSVKSYAMWLLGENINDAFLIVPLWKKMRPNLAGISATKYLHFDKQ